MPTNIDDRYLLDDMLCAEKQLIGLYGTAITEAGCPNLRRTFQQNMLNSIEDQFQIFTQMKNQGFYQSKATQNADVQQALQSMTRTKSEI